MNEEGFACALKPGLRTGYTNLESLSVNPVEVFGSRDRFNSEAKQGELKARIKKGLYWIDLLKGKGQNRGFKN